MKRITQAKEKQQHKQMKLVLFKEAPAESDEYRDPLPMEGDTTWEE